MAAYHYDERGRSSSIFSDEDRNDRWRDDRWSGDDRGRSGQFRSNDWRGERNQRPDDDRGFLTRAGDEIRSWFGDEDAERRREQDARQWEREHGTSGAYRGGHEDQWTGRQASGWDNRWTGQDRGQSGYARGPMSANRPSSGYDQDGLSRGYGDQQQGYGQGDQSGFRGSGRSGSPHDESYRRWREQQIAQLDSEYDDYCRHRQQQFEQDFSSFRQNRQARGTSGQSGDQQNAQDSGSNTLSAAKAMTGQSAEAKAGSGTADGGRSKARQAS